MWNDGEKFPSQKERLFHCPVFILSLTDISVLKGSANLAKALSSSEGSLSEYDCELFCFLTSGVSGKELVHQVCVVFAGLALSDPFVLQSRSDGMTSTGG